MLCTIAPSQINTHTPFTPVCRWLLVMYQDALLDKVMSCIHGNYDAMQSHIMFNRPYMVIEKVCLEQSISWLVQLNGIRLFHAPFHLLSQCFYVRVISTKGSNVLDILTSTNYLVFFGETFLTGDDCFYLRLWNRTHRYAKKDKKLWAQIDLSWQPSLELWNNSSFVL